MAAKKTATIRAFVALDLDPMSLRRVVRVADRLRMGSGAPSATVVYTIADGIRMCSTSMAEIATRDAATTQ